MSHRLVLAFLLLLVLICPVVAEDVPPGSIAWRVVGSQSNLPPPSPPVHFAGLDGGSIVTGQPADKLAIAMPTGSYTASFDDFGEAGPVIAGPIPARTGEWTAFDLPVEWVYEADNLVTGQQPYAEMGQTFRATGDELVKMSFLVTTSEQQQTFEVTARKSGPDGPRIGPTVTVVRSGGGWGTARWQPGDVPLTIGETYYIGIVSKSRKESAIGLHSTGDIYPGGSAFFGGSEEPASDLGLLISLQRNDAIRSRIIFANNADGWVLHSKGVYFSARSSNLRAVFAKLRVKDAPLGIICALKLSRVNRDGTLTPVGSQKTCQSVGQTADGYRVAALWGAGELPLQPPGVYFLEIEPRWNGLDGPAPKADYQVSLYGEKVPGSNPVIYNQRIAQVTPTSVKIAWEGTGNSAVRIHYGITPGKLTLAIAVPKGATEADIHPIAPGATFCFKIAAQSEAGGRFETPVYVTRALDAAGNPVTDPPLPSVPNEHFIPLATIDRLSQPPKPDVHEIAEVPLVNADFKDGITGWGVFNTEVGVFHVTQDAAVQKGRLYMLSSKVNTGQDSGSTVYKVHLIGGGYSQWYRTGGKTLEFYRVFEAQSDTASVGLVVGAGDRKISDIVQSVRLVEVKERKPSFWRRWGRESK